MRARFGSAFWLVACALGLRLGLGTLGAATIVNIDIPSLGLGDGTPVTTLPNSGTAGEFTQGDGATPTVQSHPSNNNPGASIQGLNFGTAGNLNAAMSAPSQGLSGNGTYTVRAWVWNPDFGNEETIISWGRRNGPDGTNAGFHQGVSTSFGAIGHWGAPDVPWGNQNGTNINDTAGRWAQLSWVYDGDVDSVYIDGLLSNSRTQATDLNVWDVYNDGTTPTNIVLGSESEPDGTGTTIPFSGTIAQVEVYDDVWDASQVLGAFNAEAPLFFDGIPEPGTPLLAALGLAALLLRRRWRR